MMSLKSEKCIYRQHSFYVYEMKVGSESTALSRQTQLERMDFV